MLFHKLRRKPARQVFFDERNIPGMAIAGRDADSYGCVLNAVKTSRLSVKAEYVSVFKFLSQSHDQFRSISEDVVVAEF